MALQSHNGDATINCNNCLSVARQIETQSLKTEINDPQLDSGVLNGVMLKCLCYFVLFIAVETDSKLTLHHRGIFFFIMNLSR